MKEKHDISGLYNLTPDGAFWTIKFIRKKTSLGRGELRECGGSKYTKAYRLTQYLKDLENTRQEQDCRSLLVRLKKESI